MNSREKFNAIMNFEPVEEGLFWQETYWHETIERWYNEGLPSVTSNDDTEPAGTTGGPETKAFAEKGTRDIKKYFGFDKEWSGLPINFGIRDLYEKEIVYEDTDRYVIFRGKNGIVYKKFKDNSTAMYRRLEWPINKRKDWDLLKEKNRLGDILRGLPEDYEEKSEKFNNADYPVGISTSLYGALRNLMGIENLFLKFYDDPKLVKDIIFHITEINCLLLEEITETTKIDFLFWSEDFCYKTAPLISRDIFYEFFLSGFKRVNDLAKGYGISCIGVETDGDCREAIPWMLETGATGIWPFECTNGQNIVEIRKKYPRLQIFRGIDKKALITGDKKVVDNELESKIPFMVSKGGYLPGLDHNVPPDISFEIYKYYQERLHELVLS